VGLDRTRSRGRTARTVQSQGRGLTGTVDAPRGLTIEDGFGDADGKPLTDKTRQLRMRLFEHEGGTRMELFDQFPSLEQMEEMLKMGMEEGLRQAVGQMDALSSSAGTGGAAAVVIERTPATRPDDARDKRVSTACQTRVRSQRLSPESGAGASRARACAR
jgi:hypothetical protein